MNRFIRNAVVIGVVWFGIVGAVELRPIAAADDSQAALAADAAFLQAIAKNDKVSVEKALEPDFLWVDANANQWTRAEVLQKFPPVMDADVKPNVKLYGQVAVVKAERDKDKVMRIWIKRPAGWRTLIYQELVMESAPARPPLPPGVNADCYNPCKHYPYEPKNQIEKEVLESMHGVIMGLAYWDVDAYDKSTAEDFEMTMSLSKRILTKADRIAYLKHQKETGAPPAINDPTRAAYMFDFDGAVILLAKWPTRDGLHDVNTRMFVQRNGRWVLLSGFETFGKCQHCGTDVPATYSVPQPKS